MTQKPVTKRTTVKRRNDYTAPKIRYSGEVSHLVTGGSAIMGDETGGAQGG